ncbi:MAG: hypothetical protein EAX90_11360 [Candidatus Heimdallarchaeota archaeon]|nr:hypothetical protein [Candidatus Heimdallarchaeota archaeon]
MTNKLFLEPHYGDIAWSCSGILAQNKSNSIIINIFPPRRKFYRFKLKGRIYRSKKREEKSFEKLYRVTIIYLKYKSAFLRGRTIENLFDKQLNKIEEKQVLELRNLIVKMIEDFDVSEIYCPKAQRNQIDHLIVKKAVYGITSSNIDVFYYEDFPNFLPESKKYFSESALQAKKIDISDVIEEKIKAVLAYKSLIKSYFKSKEKLIGLIRNTPFETFWIEKQNF